MPVLTFDVPLYTDSAQESGVDIRTLTTASPGTTDSQATSAQFGIAAAAGYWRPEQANTDTSALLGVGVAFGRGWALDPAVSGIVASDADGFTTAAGTWTVTVHYVRAGSLLTGNIALTQTAILFRVAEDLSTVTVREEIGRASAAITFTTTEQVLTLNISASQIEFPPGERVYLELHADKPVGLTSANCRIITNSTSATRLTAVPNYTINRAVTFAVTSGAVVQGVGRAFGAGVFDAAGAATADGRITNLFSGVFDAAGAATAQALATGIFSGVFDVAAGSTAQTVGASTFSGVFDATGSATAQTVGTSVGAGVFDAAGTATANVLASSVAGAVFSAAGLATTDGRMTNLFSGVFSAAGLGDADGRATAIFSGVFDASGAADADVFGSGIFSGVFDAAGLASGDFQASSLSGAVFSAAGIASTDYRTSTVLSGVFNAAVGGGGAASYPDGLLRLNAQGQIESVSGTSGIPSNALKYVEEIP